MRVTIISEDAPRPIGPYSQAVKCDNLIFVSGQIGIDPLTGELTKGGIKEETKRVLENIKAILEVGDSSLERVVRISVFLTNLDYFEEVNSVFEDYFKTEPPARETVEVSRLPKGANIEISAIALTKEK